MSQAEYEHGKVKHTKKKKKNLPLKTNKFKTPLTKPCKCSGSTPTKQPSFGLKKICWNEFASFFPAPRIHAQNNRIEVFTSLLQ
jgi:hypothetical protein